MTKSLTLRLPDDIHALAQQWAETDGVSLNEWLASAVERETTRRGLNALNEWAKANPDHPLLDQARHDEIDADNAAAAKEWKRQRGAA